MTLEDFFTLTEMKDGLTAHSRVQELVSVMQKEKDCAIKNAGDATRQWAAVASTIAATENKDCLDLFIQLGGLWFINRWLNDAQNVGVDTNDSFVEESVTALLRAVEKLHLDSEKAMSSGIWVTVKSLLGHPTSRIQDRARALFDNWKVGGNGDADPCLQEEGAIENIREEGQPSTLNEPTNDNDHTSGLVCREKSPLRSADNLHPERVDSGQIQNSNNQIPSPASLDCSDAKDRSPEHHVNVSSSIPEVAPMKEVLPSCPVGLPTSGGTCNFSVARQGSTEVQSDVFKVNDLSKMEKQEQEVDDPAEKLRLPETSITSMNLEPGPVSLAAKEAKEPDSIEEAALQHNVESDSNEEGVYHKLIGVRTPMSDGKSGADEIRAINSSSPLIFKTAGKDDHCCSNSLPKSAVSSGSNLGKPEVLDISFRNTEYIRTVKEGKGNISKESKDTSDGSDSIRQGKIPRSPKIIDKKNCDIELDYGIVDALEVARQVAQEVEREVRDSSSEKISGVGIGKPSSPDSVGKEDVLTSVPPKEASSRQSQSADSDSEGEEYASISDNTEAEPECRPAVESSQVTEAAQEAGGNSDKSACAFDLNEEVGSDEMDCSINAMSTPIPVVSASKPAATPGLPATPLLFEGTLGWKGSAATSAFRPASPRKNSDSEKNFSVSGNSDNSKQRQDCLDFDLNVAEGEDGVGKQIAESSGLPSGQSSVEPSPKRSRRLDLDLNSIGDDGDVQPSQQRTEGQLFYSRNGHWNPSPASSSSSMQPSVRNIDLNETDFLDQAPMKSSHIVDAYGVSKSESPVISILGAKVEVSRRESVPQSMSLSNGKAVEPAVDLTMSRSGGLLGMSPTVSYNPPPPSFAYNGLTPAPALSFSSAMYGSGGTVPYMMDSRGAPVVPRVVGSSSTVLSSYSQPPFVMNVNSAPLGISALAPSRPNFDLNAAGFMIDGGNRDALTARQYLFPGQSRAMEEHVMTVPQPSSSGVGGKRKEPDSGWETYPFNYKHPQFPWK